LKFWQTVLLFNYNFLVKEVDDTGLIS